MTADNEAAAGPDAGMIEEFFSEFRKTESRPGTRSVLVVDDEPSVRRLVSRSMKSLDPELKVHEAENGLEALKEFDAIRKADGADPLLIVTDLQMPVMDGWEFIDQLWAKFQQQGREFGVPLIVLSSSSGVKGMLFGKSVHGGKCKYQPLATVAKEECIKPMKYDSKGQKGLITWLRYFLHLPEEKKQRKG